jgi:hypothetical protein
MTKEMSDFSAITSSFLSKHLSYYIFFPKSQKPIKAVIRHLSSNTPAERIYEALVEVGFDAIGVKQMTTSRRPPSEDPAKGNLPLFLITLPRTEKSQEIFKLTGLCHISIKVDEYKNNNSLTQCFNCQKFGHVRANCSQPPPPRLYVVWRRPSAWGMSREIHRRVYTGMLLLQAGGRRETPSVKLQRMQPREGGDQKT